MTTQRRSIARIAVDALMSALFVAVMATALVQEAPHEYLGIALFASVIAHIVLNRRWFKALLRGRNNVVRVLQVVALAGLVACIVGQLASSLVLSKHAFGFLPVLPGAGWARRVHMLCSYWGFVFAFAHAGLQFKGFGRLVRTGMMAGKPGVPSAAIWVGRIAFAVIACFGAYAFVHANLGAYLLGQVQFAFADCSEPLAFAFARYASIAVLVAGVSHYVRRAIEAAGGKERRREMTSRENGRKDNIMAEILVAYFSASGTTERVAKNLAEATGADLFEIEPAERYSAADLNWNDKRSRSSIEMNDESCRPAIAGEVDDMAAYRIVFVGFPVWWYVEPRIIDTFLESYDFSGKTIVPFATSGGSGLGKAPERMQQLAPGAKVEKGGLLNGRPSASELADWAGAYL